MWFRTEILRSYTFLLEVLLGEVLTAISLGARSWRNLLPQWDLRVDRQHGLALNQSAVIHRLAQQSEALGHTDPWILFALKLQRNVAAITVLVQYGGDAPLIEIQGIPCGAAIVGLRLHQHRREFHHEYQSDRVMGRPLTPRSGLTNSV